MKDKIDEVEWKVHILVFWMQEAINEFLKTRPDTS
jgi:hypothetical protein